MSSQEASITDFTAPGADPRAGADMRRRLRAIFVGSVGNLVEWYDFYAYAAFALYFAKAFFPDGDEVVQQLNAALLFAAGFWCGRSAAGCSAISPIATAGATR